MPASDILLPDELLGCHTGAERNRRKQWHQLVLFGFNVVRKCSPFLSLKMVPRTTWGTFLQPKNVSPSQDFHHLWTVPLSRLKNTEATTGLSELRSLEWQQGEILKEVDTEPSHPTPDEKMQVSSYFFCSTHTAVKQNMLCKGNSCKETRPCMARWAGAPHFLDGAETHSASNCKRGRKIREGGIASLPHLHFMSIL